MKMLAGGAAVASVLLIVSTPAAAVDFTLAPGATYALTLKGQYGIGDGGIFSWDETAASSALYRIQLLYNVYPDQRYCADGPIGCDPFLSSDFRPYSADGWNGCTRMAAVCRLRGQLRLGERGIAVCVVGR